MSDNVIDFKQRKVLKKKEKDAFAAYKKFALDLRDQMFGDDYDEETCGQWFSMFRDMLYPILYYYQAHDIDFDETYMAFRNMMGALAPEEVMDRIKCIPNISFIADEDTWTD